MTDQNKPEEKAIQRKEIAENIRGLSVVRKPVTRLAGGKLAVNVPSVTIKSEIDKEKEESQSEKAPEEILMPSAFSQARVSVMLWVRA